jgi:NitT/TauT family transport system permease protein
MRRALDTVLLMLAGLAIWQAMHWAAPFALTSPAGTVARAWQMLSSANFWPHATETARAFAWALLLAVVGGLALGFSLGLNRTSAEVAEPILVSVYSLPKVTLYPLILLVFGLGVPAKIAFGTLHGIIPIAIFAMNAVRNVAAVHFKTARVMRLSRRQTLATIVIPGAMPEIVSGLRIGFSLTLLGTMLGELFASQRGLGFLLMTAIDLNDVQTILAIAVLISLFAVVTNTILLAIDRRLRRGSAA